MYVKENLPTKFSSPLSESDTKCPHLIFFLIEAWWSILKNAYASEEADVTGGGKKGVMGKKGMMTVMLKGIRSHRKKMRENGKRSLCFDGSLVSPTHPCVSKQAWRRTGGSSRRVSKSDELVQKSTHFDDRFN